MKDFSQLFQLGLFICWLPMLFTHVGAKKESYKSCLNDERACHKTILANEGDDVSLICMPSIWEEELSCGKVTYQNLPGMVSTIMWVKDGIPIMYNDTRYLMEQRGQALSMESATQNMTGHYTFNFTVYLPVNGKQRHKCCHLTSKVWPDTIKNSMCSNGTHRSWKGYFYVNISVAGSTHKLEWRTQVIYLSNTYSQPLVVWPYHYQHGVDHAAFGYNDGVNRFMLEPIGSSPTVTCDMLTAVPFQPQQMQWYWYNSRGRSHNLNEKPAGVHKVKPLSNGNNWNVTVRRWSLTIRNMTTTYKLTRFVCYPGGHRQAKDAHHMLTEKYNKYPTRCTRHTQMNVCKYLRMSTWHVEIKGYLPRPDWQKTETSIKVVPTGEGFIYDCEGEASNITLIIDANTQLCALVCTPEFMNGRIRIQLQRLHEHLFENYLYDTRLMTDPGAFHSKENCFNFNIKGWAEDDVEGQWRWKVWLVRDPHYEASADFWIDVITEDELTERMTEPDEVTTLLAAFEREHVSLLQPLLVALVGSCVLLLLVALSTFVMLHRRRSNQRLERMVQLHEVIPLKTKKKVVLSSSDNPNYSIDVSIGPVSSGEHDMSTSTVNTTLVAQSEYDIPLDDKWEFPRKRLNLGSVIGEGAFGVVMRAVADGITTDGTASAVAVKTLKEGATDMDMADLLTELHTLKHISADHHVNVINLLGCCTQDAPVYILTEYAEQGNLRNLLKNYCNSLLENPKLGTDYMNTDCRISQQILLDFADQIACGMVHLASLHIVHRDLACRNVLVTDDFTLKITDFGLARHAEGQEYYKKVTQGMLPVRWMALESIKEGRYNTQTDVYRLMLDCWSLKENQRPSFAVIHDVLGSGIDEFEAEVPVVLPSRTESQLVIPPVH